MLAAFFLSMEVSAQGSIPSLDNNRADSNRVMEESETAYILGTREGSLMAGLNDVIYARGDWPEGIFTYDIVRRRPIYAMSVEGQGKGEIKDEIKDEAKGDIISHELFTIAEARLIAVEGNIATLRIIRSSREVRLNDRLLPKSEDVLRSGH